MSKVKRNVAYNLTGQLITVVTGLLVYKLVYSGLGIEVLGIIVFGNLVGAITRSALDFGFSKTIIKEVASNYETDKAYTTDLTRTFASIYWLIYGAAAGVFILAADTIAEQWLVVDSMTIEEASSLVLLIGSSSLLAIPRTYFTSICVGQQNLGAKNIIDVGTLLAQHIGVIALIELNQSAITIAAWIALSNVLVVLAYITYLAKTYSAFALLPGYSKQVLTRIWVYTSKMAVLSLTILIHKQLDKVLISKFMSIGMIGIYGVAFNTVTKINTISAAISQATFPSFSKLDKSDQKKCRQQFTLLQELFIGFMAIPYLSIIFYSEILFTFVFDAAQAQTLFVPTLLLALAFYLNASIRATSIYFTAVGRPNDIVRANIAALIVVTPVTAYLIIQHGLVGAALSWIVYYGFMVVVFLPITLKREFENGYKTWLNRITTSTVIAAATYFPSWLVLDLYLPRSFTCTTLLFSLSTLAYLALTYRASSPHTRQFVRHQAEQVASLIKANVIRKTTV